MKIDTHACDALRGRYARICVQVSIDKPLLTSIFIGHHIQRILCEGFNQICFLCGKLGHKNISYPDFKPTSITNSNPTHPSMNITDQQLSPSTEPLHSSSRFPNLTQLMIIPYHLLTWILHLLLVSSQLMAHGWWCIEESLPSVLSLANNHLLKQQLTRLLGIDLSLEGSRCGSPSKMYLPNLLNS